MLRDQGYDVEHLEAPDLKVFDPGFGFSVEATTVAPSTSGPLADHPNPQSPEELAAFLSDYMPMKFGSPLLSKLNKRDAQGRHYWEKPDVEGLPFVLAIADFHRPADGAMLGSMIYSQGGLYQYLYGTRVRIDFDEGRLVLSNIPVTEHLYNGKRVPSGFFNLPKAENVSAVIFSNAATIAKFDRLGVLAGFAPAMHRYVRIGYLFDPDPNAFEGIPFQIDISDPRYEEHWGDELQVFHNPHALRPLPVEVFPDAAHFFYENGKLTTIDHDRRVLSSMTMILQIMNDGNCDGLIA